MDYCYALIKGLLIIHQFIPDSSFFIIHYSFFIIHYSFFILHSSFFIYQNSCPRMKWNWLPPFCPNTLSKP